MKDKDIKFEEIETSHTLGGSGERRVQGRGKWRGYTSYSVQNHTLYPIGRVEEDTRPGRTRERQKDLSVCESEEGGCGGV